MVYVVNRKTNEILNRCDAWELGAVSKMTRWARGAGYSTVTQQITSIGDMVLWVE